MLKRSPFILIISFLLMNASVFAFEVENNSTQDSLQVNGFVNYLVEKNHINKTEVGTLIIYDAYSSFMSLKFELSGISKNPWFHFDNTVHFELIQNDKRVFDGYVIWDYVLLNAQNYFFYKNPDIIRENLEPHYKAILAKHFADTLSLDTLLFPNVNNQSGQWIGWFKLEFKTLAFHGCLIDDNYSLIDENTYLEMPDGITDFEPVFVFYTAAPKEYTDPNRYIGTEFRMFNHGYNLVHKGVISEVSVTPLRD